MIEQQYIYNYDLICKAEQKTFELTNSFLIMQQAAKACYSFILKNLTKQKTLVLCGSGNNGGDGTLIAQHLIQQNFSVDIHYPFGFPKTDDSKKALGLLSDNNRVKKIFHLITILLLLMLCLEQGLIGS